MSYAQGRMRSTKGRPAVRIGDFDSTHEGASSRVSAMVDGFPAWFESADVELRPSPEAFASAFLVPALHRGAGLEIDAPVDSSWQANRAEQLRIFRGWWGTPERPPAAALAPAVEVRPPVTALCFSAGVDSFHALLRSGETVDALVTAHGFDIPLEDRTRMLALGASLREIAAARGIRSIVVSTNLREHPLMRSVAWELTHGGALAALGHLLDRAAGRLLIASSIPLRSRRRGWGSHWKTDRLWSSSRLEVVNVGAELRRVGKLREIAGEPLVQRHLRVCWENRAPAGNCSRCEKCLQAMLILAECGALERFTVFEGADALTERVSALSAMRHVRTSFDDLGRSGRLSPELSNAVRALIRRSRHARSLPVRARRYLMRTVMSWSRGSGP